MAEPLVVSPSLLGRYFFLNCHRMLRYSATPSPRRSDDGVPPRPLQGSVVTRAILEGGYEWEESLLEKLGSRVRTTSSVIAPVKSRDLVINQEEFLSILQSKKTHDYLYQVTLSPSDAFYARYQIDPSQIQFAICRPDLLQVIPEGSASRLRVLDIKSSDEAKFSHKVQVTLYALLLRDFLKAHAINDYEVDLDRGAIWLYQQPQPEEFDLSLIQEPLETFLRLELSKILTQQAHKARWSVSFRCEWCDYWNHCSEEAVQLKDVSLLPYFRPESKAFLQDMATPLQTIPEFKEYLQKPDARSSLKVCAHLTGKYGRLCSDVDSMLEEKIVPYGSSTIAFPRGEHIAIILSLHDDPLTGKIFAGSIRVYGGRDLNLQEQNWTAVAESDSPDGFQKVRKGFIGHLEDIMQTVDEYNRCRKDWTDRKSLQCYVFDTYENRLIQQLISEALEEPSLARRALNLFFHFQTEDLVSAQDHPAAEVPNSLVSITAVLRQVTALPLYIVYRLNEVSRILKPSEYPSIYNGSPKFSYSLSNRLRSDAWFMACKGRRDLRSTIAEIEKDLDSRTKAVYSIIRGLREKISDRLFAWPPKFLLPESSDFKQPILSKLAFMTRYEKVLDYISVRSNRAIPILERLEPDYPAALKIRLEKGSESEWTAVLEPESSHAHVEEDPFSNWLISLANNAGEREQMRFQDLYYKDKHWVPSGIAISYASIESVYGKGSRDHLNLKLKTGKNSPIFRKGDICLLHQRYTDYTSSRITQCLAELDSATPAWAVRLLEDPHSAQKRFQLSRSFKNDEAVNKFLAPFRFTHSQQIAFLRVLLNKHQLVWGPPGTGKTHFLALMICALSAVFAREKKSFQVFVTAFTHAAIENCLKKLCELWGKFSKQLPEAQFYKLSQWHREDCPKNLKAGLETDPRLQYNGTCIIGGTIYSARKHLKEPFDLVIIDEGSQLRVPDSLIPISLVSNTGRLVIAGDDKQLPPIIQGIYPEPEEGSTYLYSSIFECLRKSDADKNEFTSQLQECFRMNDVLCSFPAATLYRDQFKPATPTIAGSRLRLKKGKSKNEWLDYALDPAYPLTLIVLHEIRALKESPIEAELVTDLTIALRDRLLNEKGRLYTDDAEFWEKGLFVVSPHHAQINQIVKRLQDKRDWTPFVDTVDKMQGREADAVIISYGVADADYALLEGEFIYSLNRLNVAITRARTKAIICLSAQLLAPHTIAFANDELLEGLNFMLRLKKYLANHGSVKDFPIKQEKETFDLSIYRM